MRTLTLFLSLLVTQHLYAQNSSPITIEVGQRISDIVSQEMMYRFPTFHQGQVLSKNGGFSNALLNYNYLNGEMEFITGRDTLVIVKEQKLNIKRVTIDSTSFIYNNGFLEILLESKLGTLLKRKLFDIGEREKIGAYNTPTSTASVASYNYFTDRGNFRSLTVRETMTLNLKTEFLFHNENDVIMPVNKKSLEKILPGKKREIETYLKAHEVNFKKEEDLTSLFTSLN